MCGSYRTRAKISYMALLVGECVAPISEDVKRTSPFSNMPES